MANNFFPPRPPFPPEPPKPPRGRSVPPPPPGVFQYVGARYVPQFADPVEWQPNAYYEPLTIVTYNNNSYTSKKTVPVGISPDNQEYWVMTGNFNQQLNDLSTKIDGWDEEIAANTRTAQQAEATANAAKQAVDNLDLTGLENSVEEAIQEVEDLSSLVHENTDNIATNAADININKANIDTNTNKIATNTTDITALKSRVDTAESTIETIASDLSTANTNILTNAQEIADLKESDTTQNTAINTAQSNINILTTDVAKNKTDIASLSTEMEGIKTTTETITGQIDTIKSQSDTATAEVNRLTGVVGDDNSGLIKEFHNLKDAVESGDTNDALNGRVSLLENQVGKPATETTAATGIEAKIAELQTALGTPASDENTATGIYQKLEQNEQSITETNTNLTELAEKVGKVAENDVPATGLIAEIETLKTSQLSQDTNINNLTSSIDANTTSISNIENDLTALSNQVGKPADGDQPATGLEKKIVDLTTETESNNTELNSRIDTVESSLAEKQEMLTGKVGQVVGFNAEGKAVAQNAPSTGVKSFNGRTGDVVPVNGDYTANQVGALPITGGTMTGDLKLQTAGYGTHALSFSTSSRRVTFFQDENGENINLFGVNDSFSASSNTDNNRTVNIAAVKTPVYDNDAANKAYVDQAIRNLSLEGGEFLPLVGGRMSGPIVMTGYKITRVGDPSNPEDAATKRYVDSKLSGTGSDLQCVIGTYTGNATTADTDTVQIFTISGMSTIKAIFVQAIGRNPISLLGSSNPDVESYFGMCINNKTIIDELHPALSIKNTAIYVSNTKTARNGYYLNELNVEYIFCAFGK